MSEIPRPPQRITGQEVLNPRIYGRISEAVTRLSQQPGTDALGGRFTLGRLLMAEEDLSETSGNGRELGDYRERSTVEGPGWTRFVHFDDTASSVLEEYLGEDGAGLRGQFEFAKEVPGIHFSGLLRLYEYGPKRASANIRMHAGGHMNIDPQSDPEAVLHFLGFATSHGLESVWKPIADSPLPVSMEGYVSERMAWPIARALGRLAGT